MKEVRTFLDPAESQKERNGLSAQHTSTSRGKQIPWQERAERREVGKEERLIGSERKTNGPQLAQAASEEWTRESQSLSQYEFDREKGENLSEKEPRV